MRRLIITRPDISLAKNLLNWEPRINLKEGLAKTISCFRSIYIYK